jgi:hypothetical protein
MSEIYVPQWLRRSVSQAAKFRCGYCLTAENVVGAPMEIDHLIPQSLGGQTEESNLWLACALCNGHKSNRISGLDAVTGDMVRLFNPRFQDWSEHFRWNNASDRIVGLTPTGRATVAALNLNRASLVRARQLWVLSGWHPPRDQ